MSSNGENSNTDENADQMETVAEMRQQMSVIDREYNKAIEELMEKARQTRLYIQSILEEASASEDDPGTPEASDQELLQRVPEMNLECCGTTFQDAAALEQHTKTQAHNIAKNDEAEGNVRT